MLDNFSAVHFLIYIGRKIQGKDYLVKLPLLRLNVKFFLRSVKFMKYTDRVNIMNPKYFIGLKGPDF